MKHQSPLQQQSHHHVGVGVGGGGGGQRSSSNMRKRIIKRSSSAVVVQFVIIIMILMTSGGTILSFHTIVALQEVEVIAKEYPSSNNNNNTNEGGGGDLAATAMMIRPRKEIVRNKNTNTKQSVDAAVQEHQKDVAVTVSNDDGNIIMIPVFYNVFTNDTSAIPAVKAIVKEQLAYLRPSIHKLFVRSIGAFFNVSSSSDTTTTTTTTTLLQHDPVGDEMETLALLWDYCRSNDHNNNDTKVVYLHTKGSFHPTPANDQLRRFLTRGATSEDCTHLPDTCNVCSSRMSPIPHPHTPGNMWLARCSYVQHLMDPRLFVRAMEQTAGILQHDEYQQRVFQRFLRRKPYCVGGGRFAAEHWIYSHPSVQPCDLYPKSDFLWGYDHVPSDYNFPMQLELAPRFSLQTFATMKQNEKNHPCTRVSNQITFPYGVENSTAYDTIRTMEYEMLYGKQQPLTTTPWWKRNG